MITSLLIFKEIMYEFNLPNEIKSKIMLYTNLEICVELGYYFEAKQLYLLNKIKNIHITQTEDKLKIIKWLHYNFKCININNFNFNYNNNISLDAAASNGQLECLKFLHKIVGMERSSYTAAYALSNGHLECLKYLYENNIKCKYYELQLPINNNVLKCIRYLETQGVIWSDEFKDILKEFSAHYNYLTNN